MANKYLATDGRYYTQAQIDRKRSESYRKKHAGYPEPLCSACGIKKAQHNDHTIAQARLKILGKTDLIWDMNCYEDSCHDCHMEWEAIKNPAWVMHQNMPIRLAYLKRHDPDGYRSRMEIIEDHL